MHISFEKNVVSEWQRRIVLDVRKSAFKSPVLSVKKCHPSVIQKVSILSRKIYIYKIYLDGSARWILSIQPEFFWQKSIIEEKIMGIKGAYKGQRIMYYPKFHCELNHIEYFWFDWKSLTRRQCKYTIDRLREDIRTALSLVKIFYYLGTL